MRKVYLVVVLLNLLYCYNGRGQDINALEQKKGFKEFKLGQTFIEYKDRVWITKIDEDNNKDKIVKTYTLQKRISVKDQDFIVELSFFHDKLIMISAYRLTTNEYEFDAFKQSLFTLFGPTSNGGRDREKPQELKECDDVYLWNSETVGLELVHCTSEKPLLIEFTFWDIPANLQVQKEEF